MDLIDRQAAIEAVHKNYDTILDFKSDGRTVADSFEDIINALPSAQPDGIPLEWIDKHLEWLDNCDNDFAQLAKVGIRAMVEIWKKDKT